MTIPTHHGKAHVVFELATTPPDQPHPSDFECPCPDPDDQYLLDIDAGSVSLTHKACGKSPRGDYIDLVEMPRIPVTVKGEPYGNCDGGAWHGEHRCDCGMVLVVTVNHRAVLHDDVPFLVGRDYTDREGAAWHITDQTDAQGRPLVYLLPEGAGVDIPLAEAAADFGPLALVSVTKSADGTVFTPTIDDMEASYCGVLVASLAEGEEAIALTGQKHKALEAIDQYYREVCGQPNLLDDANARLTDAYYVLDCGYAVFTRNAVSGWEVTASSPTAPGAVPVTWFRGATVGPLPEPYARRNDPTLWGASL